MRQFENSKVFVSGGAGVIGRALVDQLYKMGALLFVGDLKPKPKHWSEDILYRQGDLNEIKKEHLLGFQPNFYFHLAASFERTFESEAFWVENYHHNIKLSHHLLDCLKDCTQLTRIVFASSYLVYDPQQYLFDHPPEIVVSLDEQSAQRPRNLCGMAKQLHEQELLFIGQRRRFTTVSARIFRGYGRGSNDVISRWVRSLIKGETIHIYGQESAFDFIFADEIAEGLIRVALSGEAGAVNLGSGKAKRISQVLSILKKAFPDIRFNESESDIPVEASQAKMELFHKWTDWNPDSDIEKGIAQVIAHEKDRLGKKSM